MFLPDTTGLDLREQERYWQYVRDGNAQNYHGIAIHPRHLSLYERFVLKRHHQYDPTKDYQMKIDELRMLYEKMNEKVGTEEKTLQGGGGDDVSDKVSQYFEWEKMTSHGNARSEKKVAESDSDRTET